MDGAYARATKFPGVDEEIFDSKKEDLKRVKRASIMRTAAERAKIVHLLHSADSAFCAEIRKKGSGESIAA